MAPWGVVLSRLDRVIFDPDTIPPSTPVMNAAVVVGQDRLDLSWTTSTDTGGSGLAGYTIQIDGANTVLGIQTSYSHTGLSAGSTHTYRVLARDGNNNSSPFSNQVSGTTQSAGGGGVSPLLVADLAARTSGPGVVWFHDFASDNEVNNFRWTGGYGSGNDPLDAGTTRPQGTCRRITSDGITGQCLELIRNTGSSDSKDFWRPLSPIQGGTTTGNGRGAGNNDPAANGTIALKSYAPTDGGSEIATGTWGVYGTKSGGGPFDGSDYYVQCRVKLDPRRQQGTNINEDSGKLFYFTRTDRSNTDQEIITYAGTQGTSQTYFRMYRGAGYIALDQAPPGTATQGYQPGNEVGICNLGGGGAGNIGNCWHWNNGAWDTIMYHIRNGTMSGGLGSQTSNSDTLIEVWAAHDGETEYTKIWNQPNAPISYDLVWGHSAVILSIYHNGDALTQFYQRYCQLIFSKDFISCPQVSTAGVGTHLAAAALNLTATASTATDYPQLAGFAFDEGQMAWQHAFYHDAIRGRLHLMAKTANSDTDWDHQWCRIGATAGATPVWQTASFGLSTSLGHIYGNSCLDDSTGDMYYVTGQMDGTGSDLNKRIRVWNAVTKTWSRGTVDVFSGGLVSHSNGLVYHPHAYGRNDGGCIIDQEFRTMCWRKSTNTMDAIGNVGHGDDQYGNKEGAGVYWPAKNIALVGGSDGSGGAKPMIRVTPSATAGQSPTFSTNGTLTPIRVQGSSHQTSGVFGSIHVHPNNPNKLMILQTDQSGQGCWESSDALTWTRRADHPFAFAPRVVCSLRGGWGAFLCLSVVGTTKRAQLWKPTP
jgi:hypothetical protein